MLKVSLIAQTQVDRQAMYDLVEGTAFADSRFGARWADQHEAETLVEFAGRACYQSWEMPTASTATPEGYHANIITQGHFSVMEHASVTLYVEGVSRSLLTELTRHRHLSFSVLSQRFVDSSEAEFVIPPALKGYNYDMAEELVEAFSEALDHYERIVSRLEARGFGRKQAREAARAVLPNMTETKMVVTGNHRAWREVIAKRSSSAADAEIRQFAEVMLVILKGVAPNLYSDFETEGGK